MGKSAAGAVWLNAERVSALRLLAVLAQHRGRRCRPLPEALHRAAARRDRAARGAEGPGDQRGQEDPRHRDHRAGARQAGGRAKPPRPRAAPSRKARKADTLPTVSVPRARLAAGIAAFELLHEAGLAESRTEARKLIKGGGGRLNDKPIAGDTATVGEARPRFVGHAEALGRPQAPRAGARRLSVSNGAALHLRRCGGPACGGGVGVGAVKSSRNAPGVIADIMLTSVLRSSSGP